MTSSPKEKSDYMTRAGATHPNLLQRQPPWSDYIELTRLHKFPLGSTVMFFPSAWGLVMAAYTAYSPPLDLAFKSIIFAIGSTAFHSGVCVLNDICDMEFDRKVERTKTRPLVTGAVSIREGWLLFSCLMILSLSMIMTANTVAALSFIPGLILNIIYPLTKRWTWWPQLWLGFAMNWGFISAWISITGSVDKMVVSIFFIGTICWAIVYDTVYACQDRKDDVHAGIKSTALLFGSWVRPILCVFAAAFVGCMAYAGYLNNQGPGFFIGSIGSAIAFFIWHFLVWEPDSADDCAAKFKANGNLGYFIWVGMLVDYASRIKSMSD